MVGILTLRSTWLGLVSWVIPFVGAFLFFDRGGQLVVPQPLFKSIMIVVFGGVGTALLVVAFRRLEASWRSGLALGCYWLAISIVLDLVVLLPLSKMSVTLYLQDIGLRYLLIPIIGTAMGVVGSRPPN